MIEKEFKFYTDKIKEDRIKMICPFCGLENVYHLVTPSAATCKFCNCFAKITINGNELTFLFRQSEKKKEGGYLIILIAIIMFIFLGISFCGCKTIENVVNPNTCPVLTIPEEPIKKEFQFELINNKFCLDNNNADALIYNIKADREYIKKLKEIIENYNKNSK